jgi:hypothetical protein
MDHHELLQQIVFQQIEGHEVDGQEGVIGRSDLVKTA